MYSVSDKCVYMLGLSLLTLSLISVFTMSVISVTDAAAADDL